jgi:hypothetical protein
MSGPEVISASTGSPETASSMKAPASAGVQVAVSMMVAPAPNPFESPAEK